jgi:hypothetical protein
MHSNGRGTPWEELQAAGYDDQHHVSFLVCPTCRTPFQILPPPDEAQMCLCRGYGQQARWEGFDFNERIHLCECCVQHVLPSGSKFSVWFCEECRSRVVDLDRRVGIALIPLGRHSFMAGIALRGRDVVPALAGHRRAQRNLEAFRSGLLGLSVRMDTLHEASKARLGWTLERCGIATDRPVPLRAYLEAVLRRRPEDALVTKAAAFEVLAARFSAP